MDKKIGSSLIASTSRGLGIIRGSLVSILVHLICFVFCQNDWQTELKRNSSDITGRGRGVGV